MYFLCNPLLVGVLFSHPAFQQPSFVNLGTYSISLNPLVTTEKGNGNNSGCISLKTYKGFCRFSHTSHTTGLFPCQISGTWTIVSQSFKIGRKDHLNFPTFSSDQPTSSIFWVLLNVFSSL